MLRGGDNRFLEQKVATTFQKRFLAYIYNMGIIEKVLMSGI